MMTAVSAAETDRAPSFPELFSQIEDNIALVVRGKPELIRLTVLCMVAEGHLLVEDVPGVGKTSLAKALARTVDGAFGRIQFTPDLLPSDVLGTAVWNQREATFELRRGPIFANILLADEINRASPKTQSALLESMAEEQVTLDGSTHPLDRPFMVIATQNPIEHQGTYPLPESQLDRFLMRLTVGYPARDDEMQVLASDGGNQALSDLHAVVPAHHITAMADYARRVHVGDALSGYLLDLAAATRSHQHLALGMSPRAVLGLQRAVRVLAAAEGRSFASPDDVKRLARVVLAHRLIVSPEAQLQGITSGDVLDDIVSRTAVPRETPAG
jgi:MoxR-like ATPase